MIEKQNCNNFRFQGPCTMLRYQCFRMADMMIRNLKVTMNSAKLCLNPCTEEFAPSSDNNRVEERIKHIVVNGDSAIENSVGINEKTKRNSNVDKEKRMNNKDNTKMPMWINDGQIFKKATSLQKCTLENKEMRHQRLNHHSMLEVYKIQDMNNNNQAACEIGLNMILKEENDVLKKNELILKESHKIEKIANDSLELLIAKHMNDDDNNIARELSANEYYKKKNELLEAVAENTKEEYEVEKISHELLQMVLVQHKVQADNEKNQMKKKTKEIIKKIINKNSKTQEKLRYAEEKNAAFEKKTLKTLNMNMKNKFDNVMISM